MSTNKKGTFSKISSVRKCITTTFSIKIVFINYKTSVAQAGSREAWSNILAGNAKPM